MRSRGIYLFCLTPAASLLEAAGTGIDGEHPLFVEVVGDIAAVLSAVELDEFSGPGAKEKMENLAWMAPRALRHEEVIMAAMDQGAVLPVRFGTVFSSLTALEEPLRQRREVLKKFFHDVAGKQEWTLKGYVNLSQARARVTAARLAAEKEQLARLSPGKRYFFEQKIKGAVDKATTSWIKGMGEEIGKLAKEASVSVSECRLQSREVTGRDDEMFFYGALLVPDESMDILERTTDEWNKQHESQGLQVELSGPWPPYHFTPEL
ncbi:MAG: GvpL/GvpF family gas vesicle protein [Syntrophales bacterium]